MTTETPRPSDTRREPCESCGRVTPHDVHVEIRQEGDPVDRRREFAREPHRVVTCRFCGREQSERMDDR